MLRLLLFVLPLGIDTLGVSISLGIKSHLSVQVGKTSSRAFPSWLSSALLFSLAETMMPLVGLAIGYAVSLLISNIMHILAPLLLIGVGVWEFLEEVHERIRKSKKHQNLASSDSKIGPLSGTLRRGGGDAGLGGDAVRGTVCRTGRPQSVYRYFEGPGLAPAIPITARSTRWSRQLLLMLSVSLDELAIGFSLGVITSGLPGSKTTSTIMLCILIGLQGFLMTLIGLALGRTLSTYLKSVKDWTEFLSSFILIALGIWLLVT